MGLSHKEKLKYIANKDWKTHIQLQFDKAHIQQSLSGKNGKISLHCFQVYKHNQVTIMYVIVCTMYSCFYMQLNCRSDLKISGEVCDFSITVNM